MQSIAYITDNIWGAAPHPDKYMRGSARGSVETETLAPLSTFFEKKVLRTPKNF